VCGCERGPCPCTPPCRGGAPLRLPVHLQVGGAQGVGVWGQPALPAPPTYSHLMPAGTDWALARLSCFNITPTRCHHQAAAPARQRPWRC
jgi:hypothetical protein